MRRDGQSLESGPRQVWTTGADPGWHRGRTSGGRMGKHNRKILNVKVKSADPVRPSGGQRL